VNSVLKANRYRPAWPSYGNPDGQEDMVIIRIAERPVDRPDEGAVRIVRKPRDTGRRGCKGW